MPERFAIVIAAWNRLRRSPHLMYAPVTVEVDMRYVHLRSTRARHALVAALATVTLAGCGGMSAKDSSGTEPASASPGRAAGVGYNTTGEAVGPSAGTVDGGDTVTASSATLVTADRDVIYTVDLTVQSDDVAATVQAAEDLVRGVGGIVFGEVSGRQDGDHTDPNRATLTLKVPPAVLDATVEHLADLGKELSRTRQAEDVTDTVTDVAARVSAARASLDRLQKLFDDATTVESLVAVESEIARRQSDLESLQARQRALSAQVALATVTLDIVTVKPAAAAKTYDAGFIGGLHRGWHGLSATVTGLLTAFGTVAPFLLLLLPIGALGAYLRRRRLRGQLSGDVLPSAPPAASSTP